jgi:hypothetical protein
MKIYMSRYRNHWFSPYPIVAKIFRTDDWDDPRVEKWAEHRYLQGISKGIQKFLDFVHPRITYVKIDKWDTWSMDTTLAFIILPMLKQLKETKHGAPLVDDIDVPEELKSTSAPPKENDWDTDANHFKRWDWVLDEMIWAFGQILDPDTSSFESGVMDFKTEPFQINEEGKTLSYKIVQGLNHTHKIDKDAEQKYHDRIKNGTLLFGKYYQGLWD